MLIERDEAQALLKLLQDQLQLRYEDGPTSWWGVLQSYGCLRLVDRMRDFVREAESSDE